MKKDNLTSAASEEASSSPHTSCEVLTVEQIEGWRRYLMSDERAQNSINHTQMNALCDMALALNTVNACFNDMCDEETELEKYLVSQGTFAGDNYGMPSPLTMAQEVIDRRSNESMKLRHALRELSRWKLRDGSDCWCDGGDHHSPGCKAARALFL